MSTETHISVQGEKSMDRDQVSQVVRECIAVVLGVAENELAEDTDLRAEYDIDSLELTEIGARLESEFGIRLALDELGHFQNLGDAVALMHKRLSPEVATI
ncbi:acyl carrier protein [Streptomyces sp. NPDC001933]|uniref:acyl carrier protein n=1 Tax=Streptomyces sp. NPDC001933 TaxID=3364626 RepID=UPI0036AB2295